MQATERMQRQDAGSALVETVVCLAGMAVWLWIAFYCANALGAWLAG